MILKRTFVRDHELALRFRNGNLRDVLGPGSAWALDLPFRRLRDEVVDTRKTRFTHRLIDVLVRNPVLVPYLTIVDLRDTQRAIVWREGRLAFILGPGKHALWKAPFDLAVEIFDVDTFRLEHEKLDVILDHEDAGTWLGVVDVPAFHEALVFRDGKLVARANGGRMAFWRGAGRPVYETVDRREETADVAGQEIMTRDKVTLRVNLAVTYRVVDAVQAVTATRDYTQTLYREAQLALRAAVGTRTLDALLAAKQAVGGDVQGVLAERAKTFGVEVRSVGLRDIVLPGDMKSILNQVIEAQKRAEANLIRRREETAAARSQANTAKLLAQNPTLARIKELELLQDVLAGTKATFVFGAGSVADQVRGLVTKDE